jgi:hypothetical protein
MDVQAVKWEHYPLVADHPAARSFVERLALKGKRPKTVDAYARAIEDLLVYFSQKARTRGDDRGCDQGPLSHWPYAL